MVAFTGHAYALADVEIGELVARGADGYGGAHAPDVVAWLASRAGAQATIGSLDVVLVAVGRGSGAPAGIELRDDLAEHSRVRRAAAHRRGIEVWGDSTGLVVLGRGLVGRRELSVELFAASDAPTGPLPAGHGRRLIEAALALIPAGEWCWAQVAAGNARSLRAFLAAGFVPVCSEVLIDSP